MVVQPLSWKTVARQLALRMQHHAYCPDHSRDEEDLDNCPFCNDRWAYELFKLKLADEESRAAGRAARERRRATEQHLQEHVNEVKNNP